jgi:hypothetical protein
MASDGPRSPATVAMVFEGDVAWSDPNAVKVSNNAYCTISSAFNSASDTIDVTNFSFAVPSGATINGIDVEIECKGSGVGVAGDSFVQLLKAGSAVGSNKALGSAWPTSDTYVSHGGASDLWGTTWTDSQINASNFGVRFAAVINTSGTASVDHIRITVYYTEGGGGGSAGAALLLLGVG